MENIQSPESMCISHQTQSARMKNRPVKQQLRNIIIMHLPIRAHEA